MVKLFGTDGIRGDASSVLTSDLVRRIGRAIATWSRGGRIVVGRDTRASGPRIETALVEGATGAGSHLLLGGVLPTAAVAYLMGEHDCDVGVVISASHNPPGDNGIKIFGRGGWKLAADDERAIEGLIETDAARTSEGTAEPLPRATESYIDHLVAVATHGVSGCSVVVDCANGAASEIAPRAFARLGLHVTAMNADGNGAVINDGCGALHPEVVADAARRDGAIGITLDGDADRVLLADEDGRLIDGDAILAVMAQELKDEGRLDDDTIVVTVMANQALRRWCDEVGIKLVETAVGDRYVLEALRARDLVLGGEQSGHIIRLDQSTTGDGILAAIAVLDAVAASGERLADLVPFEPFPQVLVNVKTPRRDEPTTNRAVQAVVEAAEQKLGADGRVLVRPSGTELLVRVMVEAPDEAVARATADDVASAIRAELGT